MILISDGFNEVTVVGTAVAVKTLVSSMLLLQADGFFIIDEIEPVTATETSFSFKPSEVINIILCV